MKPMSPACAALASVEISLAMVSQSPPALRSARAFAAVALAAAFASSVGRLWPVSSSGVTAIIHA
jgi:hypothetical protein